MSRDLRRRLAITVGAPLASVGLGLVRLPGIDTSTLAGFGPVADELFGVSPLGLSTVFNAAILVELLAVLLPRWRPWRIGGYEERERLWTRLKIAAVLLVGIQAVIYVRYLRSFPPQLALLPADRTWLLFATQVCTIVAASFVLVWLARTVDLAGLGGGFAIILLASEIGPVASKLWHSAGKRIADGEPILLPLGLAAVTVAAVTRLTSGKPLRPRTVPAGRAELPAPAGGLEPVVLSWAILNVPSGLNVFGVDVGWLLLSPGSTAERAAQAGTIAVLSVLFAWLFNRPRAVAEDWRRAGLMPADETEATDLVRGAFTRSLAWSVGVGWGITGVQWVCQDANLHVELIALTMASCLVADLVGEIQFRLKHGALAPIRPVHRLYTLSGLLAILDRAGIPAHPRSRHYKTLWNFFAPLVPVEILVPSEHAERAEATIGALAAPVSRSLAEHRSVV